MKCSILLPSFKRSDLLYWGLYSLTYQVVDFEFEVLVINDGIEDETKKVCDKFRDDLNIRYIFSGQRNKDKIVWRVPGFALNVGAKLSRAQYLILSCPEVFSTTSNILKDVIVQADLSEKTIVTPYVCDDYDGKLLNHLELSGGEISKNESWEYVNRYKNRRRRGSTLFFATYSFPYFWCLPRQLYCLIGGYDEDFIGTHSDDNDFRDRLFECGYRLKVIEEINVFHLFHDRNRSPDILKSSRYIINRRLYNERKGKIVRNENKEWGKLNKGSV